MAARTKQLRSTFRVGSDAEYLAQLVARLVKLIAGDMNTVTDNPD